MSPGSEDREGSESKSSSSVDFWIKLTGVLTIGILFLTYIGIAAANHWIPFALSAHTGSSPSPSPTTPPAHHPTPSETPPSISPSASPPPNGPVSYASLVALIPARFRSSCNSNRANVNAAAGETASARCTIADVDVTYAAYASESDLTSGLDQLGTVTQPGNCVPPSGSSTGIIDSTQSFDFRAGTRSERKGTVFCNDGNGDVTSTIGWTDQNLPLILGVITAPPGISYAQLYQDWRSVLRAE